MFQIIGYIIFFILGGYLFLFGYKKLNLLYRLRREGQHTYADVVELNQDNLSFTPIVQFVDDKNLKVRGSAKNSISVKYFSIHKIGDRVKIIYDTTNSSTFVINQISDIAIGVFFCVGGVAFMAAVLITLFRKMSLIF